MNCDCKIYFVLAAITLSLAPGLSALPTELFTEDHEVGASQDKQVELFTPNVPNGSFIVHPFECEINGLSRDEIDGILAGSSHSMKVTVLDGESNDSYTVETDKGDQVYNLELNAVSNTLIVKGQALLNNSDGNVDGTSFHGSRCEVAFQDAKDKTDGPKILSTYNHVVFMKGAPEQVISCTAQGFPRPSIRWFSYNPAAGARVLIEKNPKHSRAGETVSYLIFSEVTNETSGNYTCLAENRYGRVHKTFEVEVISVEAINPHCNDLDDGPFSSTGISKRHLWYQWRGQKIYIPPFNGPFDPPNQKQHDTDLQKMINNMAERLILADKVAVNKWDNNVPVEDIPREQIILDNMVRLAQNRGLDPTWARQYFRDQIEANKDIQYELLRMWNLQGRRPPGPPVDLGNEIRPKIDAINDKLMTLATATQFQRKQLNCTVEVERNARFATFLYNLDPLHQKALQRASENVCISLQQHHPHLPQSPPVPPYYPNHLEQPAPPPHYPVHHEDPHFFPPPPRFPPPPPPGSLF